MKITILAALLFISLPAFAQRGEHTDAIEISAGITRFGENKLTSDYGNAGFGTYKIGYLHYFAPKWYFQASGWISREAYNGGTNGANGGSNENLLYHRATGGDFNVGYTFMGGPDSKLTISLLAGATLSNEKGNWSRTGEKVDEFVQSKAGGLIGFELEYYFSPRWSVFAAANEHFVGTNTHTDWGYRRWYILAGARYHLHWNWPKKKSDCVIIHGNKATPATTSATQQQ